MKRETRKGERNTVRELTDRELRQVLGGQNVPSRPVNPPDAGGPGYDIFLDPSGASKK
jgi:hypothetical protein